ncbi:MAG: hypothetical protein QM477_02980 [Planctomycetota bacterium]
MNRQSIIALLPWFALGACAQPQNSGTQANTAPEEVVVMQAEEAMVQTVNLSVTGMT